MRTLLERRACRLRTRAMPPRSPIARTPLTPPAEEVAARFTELRQAARVERARLDSFFDFCCYDHSFVDLRRRTRQDLEVTGNAFWEVLRDGKGDLARFVYVPSYTVRLLPLDREAVEVRERVRVSTISFDTVSVRRRPLRTLFEPLCIRVEPLCIRAQPLRTRAQPLRMIGAPVQRLVALLERRRNGSGIGLLRQGPTRRRAESARVNGLPRKIAGRGVERGPRRDVRRARRWRSRRSAFGEGPEKRGAAPRGQQVRSARRQQTSTTTAHSTPGSSLARSATAGEVVEDCDARPLPCGEGGSHSSPCK